MTANADVIKAALRAARKVPDPVPSVTAREAMPVIHILRQKNMSWREIGLWCVEHHMRPWSMGGLANAYRDWQLSLHTKRGKRSPRSGG